MAMDDAVMKDGNGRWRKILWGVTGAGALAAAAWLAPFEDSADASTEEGPASASKPLRRSGGNAELGPCAFVQGTRMAYEVTTRTHATLDLSPISDRVKVGGRFATQTTKAQDRQATRRWHLDMTAVAHAADGSSVLAARIVDGGTELEGEGTSPVDEALATPFLVRVDPRCGIEEFGWRTDGDEVIARRQQALVAALTYWAPGRDGALSYGGVSFDALGRYRGIYEGKPGGTIEARIDTYVEPFSQPRSPVPPTLDVERSSLVVEPGVGEWLTSLRSERRIALRVEDEQIGTMHSWVEAERAEPSAWDHQVEVGDGGWTWGLLLESPPETGNVDTAVNEALAALSAEDAVAQYLAMVHGGQTTAQYSAFLREWLRANPDGAATLVQMLEAGAFDDEAKARSALFYALGTADTPQATEALMGLVGGDDSALAHRVSAAHALAQLESPPAEVVDVLAAQAERSDIHPAARGSLAMAMGTFANKNDARSSELATAAREQIRGWLDEPGDVDELSGSLLAAGNAGHDDLVGSIAPYLDHDEPRIRQQAAHALRQMSPEEAFPRLQSSLGDDERSVRVKVLATATEVSRNHGVVPPQEMIDTAADWLSESLDRSEERALIALLGEAAERGSQDARDALEERLEAELASEERDPARIKALGAYSGTRWTAE